MLITEQRHLPKDKKEFPSNNENRIGKHKDLLHTVNNPQDNKQVKLFQSTPDHMETLTKN